MSNVLFTEARAMYNQDKAGLTFFAPNINLYRCVHACVCACMCTCVCICMCMYVRVCMHACMCVHAYMCVVITSEYEYFAHEIQEENANECVSHFIDLDTLLLYMAVF